MANRYWAATKIKAGTRKEDGTAEGKYVANVFEPGDEVKGLDAETMKGLWQAGALTRTAPEKEEEEETDEATADSKPSRGRQGGSTPSKPNTSEAPPAA